MEGLNSKIYERKGWIMGVGCIRHPAWIYDVQPSCQVMPCGDFIQNEQLAYEPMDQPPVLEKSENEHQPD